MVIATSKGVSRNTGGGKVLEKLAIFYKLKNKQETMIEKQFNINIAREINGKVRYGKIKTKNGQPVRIICWNAKGDKPIIALVDYGTFELPAAYTKEGWFDKRPNVISNFDLVIQVEGGEA